MRSNTAFISEKEVGLNSYFSMLSKVPLLTKEQEQQLALKAQKGDKTAKNRMVEHHLRLVIKIALQYRATSSLSILDLIEEGNLGLMHAVDKFEPQKGNRFSTYAIWWIYHYVDRALMNYGSVIRVPVHILKNAQTYRRLEADRLQNEGCVLSDDQKQEISDLKKSANAKPMSYLSFDDPDSQIVLSSVSALHEDSNFLEDIEDANMMDRIFNAMNHLNCLEKTVIISRFGLSGGIEQTLETLADELNYSREGIRQIQKLALKKLKNMLSS